MKSSTIIFILLIAGGIYYLFSIGYLTPDDIPIYEKPIMIDKDLSSYMDDNNYEVIDFSDSNPMVLKFKSDYLIDMPAQVYSVAAKTYNIYKKPLVVEGYFRDNPVLSLLSSDLSVKDNFVLEDIRTDKFRIETDIGIFDVLVDDIKIEGNDLYIKLEYFGEEEDFLDDFIAMSFVSIQDIPSLKTITISYVKDSYCFSLKTTAQNVLKLYEKEISLDSFLNSLTPNICSHDNKCPTGEELKILLKESKDKLYALMGEGKGDTPEAQEAYKEMKFYRDCNEII